MAPLALFCSIQIRFCCDGVKPAEVMSLPSNSFSLWCGRHQALQNASAIKQSLEGQRVHCGHLCLGDLEQSLNVCPALTQLAFLKLCFLDGF